MGPALFGVSNMWNAETERLSRFMCCQGSIPDMTSTTDMYLQLQRLYREQADLDISAVERHMHVLLKNIGRSPASIPRSSVSAFVKNARNLRCSSQSESHPPVFQGIAM